MTSMTPEMVEALWKEAERERAFWAEHDEEYLARYLDQFVAVKDGEVVAASGDLIEMDDMLRRKGLTPQKVWLRFIAEPRDLLL